MDNALEIRNLSKRYIVAEDRAQTLKETVLGLFKTVERDEVLALKPLDLDVARGESLGVIGQNGAGKSTFLKLIAGVTTPTTGSVRIHGKLNALIELGAGFEPELSGAENVFLNGAVLGLPERRIRAMLDSIVEFAGLEGFIFSPVRTYSSGMAMRLGFAVAAHLNPDILIIDEHLAVGDIAFQAKCIAKLKELKAGGATIVLVTHSLDVAELLCDRVMWLRKGEVVQLDEPLEAIKRYEQALLGSEIKPWSEDLRALGRIASFSGRFGTGEAAIERFSLLNAEGRPAHVFGEGEPMTMEIVFEAKREIPRLNVGIGVYREDKQQLFEANAVRDGRSFHARPGRGTIRVELDALHARPGRYLIDVGLMSADSDRDFYDFQVQHYHFRVEARHALQLTSAVRQPYEIEARGAVNQKMETAD